jgi:hypothetical protein
VSTTWRTYEEVAQYLLNEFAAEFGLGKVEGKQIVPGDVTEWEIDAKGVQSAGDGFVIVECRRRKRKMDQGQAGHLAYAIRDTGAQGGIVVSPAPPQSGAQKIMAREGIVHVRLTSESTTTEYVLQFLNKVFVGLSGHAVFASTGMLKAEVLESACVSGHHTECSSETCSCECHGRPKD